MEDDGYGFDSTVDASLLDKEEDDFTHEGQIGNSELQEELKEAYRQIKLRDEEICFLKQKLHISSDRERGS